ncbi:MAG: hypothetical protein U1E92_00320 [Moraxella osloensis]
MGKQVGNCQVFGMTVLIAEHRQSNAKK